MPVLAMEKGAQILRTKAVEKYKVALLCFCFPSNDELKTVDVAQNLAIGPNQAYQ